MLDESFLLLQGAEILRLPVLKNQRLANEFAHAADSANPGIDLSNPQFAQAINDCVANLQSG
ncbi:hypothetical protein [Paraburkholderia strydomiana]|uniref:hypothetical protein n=1 Tax=Paraburkholderia strydomiana TaxID=1245417 RepID=UPI0038BA5DD4